MHTVIYGPPLRGDDGMTAAPRPAALSGHASSTTRRLRGTLEAALAAGDVAAVLLRLADADERSADQARQSGRAPSCSAATSRSCSTAAPKSSARAGADGAHLTGIEAFAAALAALKPDRIAGAGGLRSRHDAMLAGEAGADYVMFGEPDRRGRPSAVSTRCEERAEVVGGTVRDSLRRLRRERRRSPAAGAGRRRFRRAR